MEQVTKNIIKKEALIILGIIVLSAFIIGALLLTDLEVVGEMTDQEIVTFVVMVALLGYPAYLVIRLIGWAIGTLKQK